MNTEDGEADVTESYSVPASYRFLRAMQPRPCRGEDAVLLVSSTASLKPLNYSLRLHAAGWHANDRRPR